MAETSSREKQRNADNIKNSLFHLTQKKSLVSEDWSEIGDSDEHEEDEKKL